MKKEIIVNPNDLVFTVKEASILLKTDEPTVRTPCESPSLAALRK